MRILNGYLLTRLWSGVLPRWLIPSAIALCGSIAYADSRDLETLLTWEQHYSLASEALSLGDIDDAVGRLRISAGMGHVQSMEVLGMVFLHGPALFGSRAPINYCEGRRWLQGAQAAGSHIAVTYASLTARARLVGPAPDCGQ